MYLRHRGHAKSSGNKIGSDHFGAGNMGRRVRDSCCVFTTHHLEHSAPLVDAACKTESTGEHGVAEVLRSGAVSGGLVESPGQRGGARAGGLESTFGA